MSDFILFLAFCSVSRTVLDNKELESHTVSVLVNCHRVWRQSNDLVVCDTDVGTGGSISMETTKYTMMKQNTQ